MLETAREKSFFPKSEIPEKMLFRKIVEEFIEAIPTEGYLFDLDELKKGEGDRAFEFGQIYERLETILSGFGSLSRDEQEEIMARIGTVKKEAHRWSHISSTRDIERELDKMVARARSEASHRPKLKIVREKYRA